MSNYKFSPKELSFYPVQLLDDYKKAGTLPDDLNEVTDEVYNKFMGGPPHGMVRGSTVKGQPCWVDFPAPTKEESIASASALKSQCLEQATNAILPLQDAVELGISTDDEVESLKAWKSYRVSINRIDPKIAPDISWPTPPGG